MSRGGKLHGNLRWDSNPLTTHITVQMSSPLDIAFHTNKKPKLIELVRIMWSTIHVVVHFTKNFAKPITKPFLSSLINRTFDISGRPDNGFRFFFYLH